MDFQHVEDYSAFPWPERLWFVAVFLVAAVWVARFRPAWLRALWLDAWLLAVAWTLLSLELGWPRPLLLAEIVLASGIPTGLTALWLARTRHQRVLGLAAVQGASAPLVYVLGIVAARAVLMAIGSVTGG